MPNGYKLDGFKEFEERLANFNHRAIPLVKQAMGTSLAFAQSLLNVYPPQPRRDRSKTFNTYVRGIGNFPRAAFGIHGVLGKRIPKEVRAAIRYTSQQFSKKWRMDVTEKDGEVLGTLENKASYSGYLVGPKDKSLEVHQASFHDVTGWFSVDDAAPQIQEDFMNGLKDIGKALARG